MQPNTAKAVDTAEILLAILPWAILLFAILFAMAISVHVLGKWRGRGDEDYAGRATTLKRFQEMHERGEVSDEEFREIKTQLAGKVQAELSNSDETG